MQSQNIFPIEYRYDGSCPDDELFYYLDDDEKFELLNKYIVALHIAEKEIGLLNEILKYPVNDSDDNYSVALQYLEDNILDQSRDIIQVGDALTAVKIAGGKLK